MKISIKLISFAFLFLFLSCARNPVTGKKEFMLMSEEQEIALGKDSDPQIVATYGLYQDDKIQNFIEEKGQEMAKVSHRSHLDFKFRVLDSPIVNAFAVPGGYVYFTRGILAHFNNEAEFAGVLGHEIGHVTARHSAKQYSQQTLAGLGLAIGSVFTPAEFGDIIYAANSSIGLLFLKFSRDHESESDKLGVEYSTRVGYQSKEMANFFNTIDRLQGQSGQEIPDFLSTHPDPIDRLNSINKLSEQWQSKLQVDPNSLKINRETYLQMINGIVYGEDPRQGFFENNFFYHPQMKFFHPVPEGWQTLNSPTRVQMADKDGKAVMVLQLGDGSSTEAVANTFVTENKLEVIESKKLTLHGKQVQRVLALKPDPETGGIKVLAYAISHNKQIFLFYGLTLERDYNTFSSTLSKSMGNFKTLTDQNKLSRKPERVKVVKAPNTMTLEAALNSHNIPKDRMEEFAILNGMKLQDDVSKGTYYKVLQ